LPVTKEEAGADGTTARQRRGTVASLHNAAPAAPVGALFQRQATGAPGRRDCSHSPGHLVTGGEMDSAGTSEVEGGDFPR
jgi:hypothetical protein